MEGNQRKKQGKTKTNRGKTRKNLGFQGLIFLLEIFLFLFLGAWALNMPWAVQNGPGGSGEAFPSNSMSTELHGAELQPKIRTRQFLIRK